MIIIPPPPTQRRIVKLTGGRSPADPLLDVDLYGEYVILDPSTFKLQQMKDDSPDSAISALMEKPYPRNGFSATVGGGYQIKKITYTHDAMIDMLIKHPEMSKSQLAAHFGYTVGWVSQVTNSDAFRERLAERKDAVVDPALRLSVEERIRGMIDQANDVIMRKLNEAPNAAVAIKALTAGAQAIGMGQKAFGGVVQNNYIALVPPTAKTAADWTQQYRPDPLVIEHKSEENGENQE